MGHALNNTLQDILCRFERMRGKDVLWQPGTDHAGIATQMVVERQLMERQEPGRRDMGREKFLERVWEWKAESGGTIINQLKRLGASCDWSRERFTMDEGLSRAVLKVFVELYNAGPDLQGQAAGQLGPEAADRDLRPRGRAGRDQGPSLALQVSDRRHATSYIIVATTRPETMLGDTAVAVHPDDERYKHLIGKHAILPLVGRRIPIVADDYADPEKGTGAVKITPAHDFNDFEVGKRHNLPQVNVLDVEAQARPAGQRGVPRRRAAVAELDETLTLHGARPLRGAQGDRRAAGGARACSTRSSRTRTWCRTATARNVRDRAVPHRPVVRRRQDAGASRRSPRCATGKTTFVPKNWEKTYFDWMENIQPWCISRQLWWGHQIPAWYGPDGKVFVAETEDEASRALAYYAERRDQRARRDMARSGQRAPF